MVYFLLVLLKVNPYLFAVQGPKLQGLIIIQVAITTVFFPLIAVALMKMLGLIQSVSMETRQERVGPLIVTGIFYIWMYLNLKNNDYIPDAYSFFVLGSTISLFIAFFLNNFTKISLHAIGVGGFLMAMIFTYLTFSYDSFTIGDYVIQSRMLIIAAVLIAGVVSSARLLLKAHAPDEVYGGFFVGAVAQLVAYAIVF